MSTAQEDPYTDPASTPEILQELRNLPTIGGVKELIDKTFPGWMIAALDGYCSDYPHLSRNWSTICDAACVGKTQILIVEDLCFDETHTLIRSFAECLTAAGFSIRRQKEFIPCQSCNIIAVPSPETHEFFKGKASVVQPDKWEPVCASCRKD